MKIKKNILILERFDGIEKYPVKESYYRFETDDSMPLNGQIINGKTLDITIYFKNNKDSYSTTAGCEEPNIFIEINGTHNKFSKFGEVGDVLNFSDYVCTDEWEVMATVYCYSHINIIDGEIKILESSSSEVTVSITGKICDPNYGLSKLPTRFYFLGDLLKYSL